MWSWPKWVHQQYDSGKFCSLQRFTFISIRWWNSSVKWIYMCIVYNHGKTFWVPVSPSISSQGLATTWPSVDWNKMTSLNNDKVIMVSEETLLFHWYKKGSIKGITNESIKSLILGYNCKIINLTKMDIFTRKRSMISTRGCSLGIKQNCYNIVSVWFDHW